MTRAEYEDAPVAAEVVNGGEGFVREGACFVRIHSGPKCMVVVVILSVLEAGVGCSVCQGATGAGMCVNDAQGKGRRQAVSGMRGRQFRESAHRGNLRAGALDQKKSRKINCVAHHFTALYMLIGHSSYTETYNAVSTPDATLCDPPFRRRNG